MALDKLVLEGCIQVQEVRQRSLDRGAEPELPRRLVPGIRASRVTVVFYALFVKVRRRVKAAFERHESPPAFTNITG